MQLAGDGRGNVVACINAGGQYGGNNMAITAAVSETGRWSRATRVAAPGGMMPDCAVGADGQGNVWVVSQTGGPYSPTTAKIDCDSHPKLPKCREWPIVVAHWQDGKL